MATGSAKQEYGAYLRELRAEKLRRMRGPDVRSAKLKPVPWVADSFVEFCSQIGVTLTPAQRVLFGVVCDGAEPGDFTGEDREFALKLFGPVTVLPLIARAVVAGLIGARSGKSFLFSLRVLHLALIHPLSTLAEGEQGFGLLVAPDLRLAKQALRYVAGAVRANDALQKMAVSDTQESISLRRDDGRVVTIECLPATRGGSAVRGRSLFAAFLDEAAFFRDDAYVVNDEELYKAIAPRVLPGGMFAIMSTPWSESGLVYDLWKENYGTPTTAIGVHAATTLLRDDEHTHSFVDRERIRDPENAAREFDAEPMTAGASKFFDPTDVAACLRADLPVIAAPRAFARAWCGLDTAFRKDPSAAVIVREVMGHLEIAEVVEIVVPKGERLKPSETIRALLARAEFHHCEAVIADGHYIESVREHIGSITLTEAPADKAGPYVETRTELKERRLWIPEQHSKLVMQLKDVIGKPMSGGHLQITSPRKGGAHGDLVSALTLATWAAVRSIGAAPVVTRGGAGITGSLGVDRHGKRVRPFR